MTLKQIMCLNIQIKKNDSVNRKRLEKTMIDFFNKVKCFRDIVWLGVYGFGRRGKSTVHWGRLLINQPMIIEIIDEEENIPPSLFPLKQTVGDNALVTIHRVQVV